MTPFQDVPVKIQKGLHTTIPQLEPRAFYLTTRAPYVSLPSPRIYNGIQKRKRKQRNDLAVFVEAKGKAVETLATPTIDLDTDMNDPIGPQSNQRLVEIDDVVQYKRPGATIVELQWRAKNWDKAKQPVETTDTGVTRSHISAIRSAHTEEYSMKLAEELHHLAMLETYGAMEFLRQPSTSLNRIGLRFQPKPPPQRHGGKEGDNVESEEHTKSQADAGRANGGDDNGEWLYHTYHRRPNPSQTVSSDGTTYVDPFQNLDIEKVGLLVIKPEDEQLWETYVTGGDSGSDKDWNSEEEDENGSFNRKSPRLGANFITAEDFYGNDYPEEEVDSEDEYGRGAYRHRNGASDDEEYDDNDGSWSDEKVEKPKLWKSRP